jgi:hypothetical protein
MANRKDVVVTGAAAAAVRNCECGGWGGPFQRLMHFFQDPTGKTR